MYIFRLLYFVKIVRKCSKLENQEKERAKIYDDVETVIQQERQYAQEKVLICLKLLSHDKVFFLYFNLQ